MDGFKFEKTNDKIYYRIYELNKKIYINWHGKWSYGYCYSKGTTIKCDMCVHEFDTTNVSESCTNMKSILSDDFDHGEFGHNGLLKFHSIDEVLKFLSKPSNKCDYIDDLKTELMYSDYYICDHVKKICTGERKHTVFRRYYHNTVCLIEYVQQLINELIKVNIIAKKHNVTFEWL